MNINLKNTTKDGVVTIHTFGYKDNGSYFSTGNFEIYKNGKLFNYPIHKWLMVMDYKGQIPEGFEVDHEDGNIHNNDISNLRIVTREYNRNKGYKKLVDNAMSKFFIK
ncbi:HNH endonuclease signature motif containing protein [Klebsiella pneumoniae]